MDGARAELAAAQLQQQLSITAEDALQTMAAPSPLAAAAAAKQDGTRLAAVEGPVWPLQQDLTPEQADVAHATYRPEK